MQKRARELLSGWLRAHYSGRKDFSNYGQQFAS